MRGAGVTRLGATSIPSATRRPPGGPHPSSDIGRSRDRRSRLPWRTADGPLLQTAPLHGPGRPRRAHGPAAGQPDERIAWYGSCKSHSAPFFAELLALLNRQLADYDDAIASAIQRHPDAPIFASFPGVGAIGTAVPLSDIGEDRSHYPTPETLLAEAGLAAVTRASGRSRQMRFRYAGNTRLRGRHVVIVQLAQRMHMGQQRLSRRPSPRAYSSTGPSVASAHDGPGSSGVARPTAPPTTKPYTSKPTQNPPHR
jgi:hypothetical protein